MYSFTQHLEQHLPALQAQQQRETWCNSRTGKKFFSLQNFSALSVAHKIFYSVGKAGFVVRNQVAAA
jgi:hypothetical protein